MEREDRTEDRIEDEIDEDERNDIELSVLVIKEENNYYGIHIDRVIEVIKIPFITPMPKQDPCLRGVFNYKGTIIPAFSLGKLCTRQYSGKETTCVIFKEYKGIYGLTVEKADEIIRETKILEFPIEQPESGKLKIKKAIREKDTVFILDVERIIESFLN